MPTSRLPVIQAPQMAANAPTIMKPSSAMFRMPAWSVSSQPNAAYTSEATMRMAAKAKSCTT